MKAVATIIFSCMALLGIAAACLRFTDFGCATYSSIAAPYPESWLKIEPGMISDEARKLVGQPWADGRQLKTLDRWRQIRSGVELHMDIWFENQNEASSTIQSVVRWKHFMGLDTDRHVDTPLPKDAEQNGGGKGGSASARTQPDSPSAPGL